MQMSDFRNLFKTKYPSSQVAVEHCQDLAQRIGFSIRIRTSKLNTIYIVCSKEGKSDYLKGGLKKRNRFSERCNCKWKVILFCNTESNLNEQWEFRAGKSMTHNHQMVTQPYFSSQYPPTSRSYSNDSLVSLNQITLNKLSVNSDFNNFDPKMIKFTTLPTFQALLNSIPDPKEPVYAPQKLSLKWNSFSAYSPPGDNSSCHKGKTNPYLFSLNSLQSESPVNADNGFSQTSDDVFCVLSPTFSQQSGHDNYLDLKLLLN